MTSGVIHLWFRYKLDKTHRSLTLKCRVCNFPVLYCFKYTGSNRGCHGSSRHNLHLCARSEGASRRCSSSLVSMIGVCVRKDVKVRLVDGRGGRRGGNWSRNKQNATFKTPWTALSAAALRSARNATGERSGKRTTMRGGQDGTMTTCQWDKSSNVLGCAGSAVVGEKGMPYTRGLTPCVFTATRTWASTSMVWRHALGI